MKNITERKGIDGVIMSADMISAVYALASKPENAKLQAECKNVMEYASKMLKNNAQEIVDLVSAAIDDDASQLDGIALFGQLYDIISRPEILKVFGWQGKTPTSSCSAPTITEADRS